MNTLDLYFLLPYHLKVFAASMYGRKLLKWRVNRETEKQIDQAIQREKWGKTEWEKYQEENLAESLNYAATQVPYYRDMWSKRRIKGDHSSSEYLENWPILTKEDLRSNGNQFFAQEVKRHTHYLDYTSGTTGVPIGMYFNKEAMYTYYALFEARWLRWNKISRFDRYGVLGGRLITKFTQAKPPFWVWNSAMGQLYLSSYHITFNNVSDYLNAIDRYQLKYLYGYTSSLYDLARFTIERGLQVPPLTAILTNAEPLYEYKKKMLQKAFSCPIVETYGQAEMLCAASECECGSFHLWPELGMTEVFADVEDVPAATGEVGRLVCTGFLNKAMPLIRYDLGDRAILQKEGVSCSCKRNLPMIKSLEGRFQDMIITKDGRRIEAPDTVFQANMPIKEVQIIQENIDTLCVKIIPSSNYDNKYEKELITGLKNRVGDMDIIIEKVDNISRSKSGKRKVIVSKIDHISQEMNRDFQE